MNKNLIIFIQIFIWVATARMINFKILLVLLVWTIQILRQETGETRFFFKWTIYD